MNVNSAQELKEAIKNKDPMDNWWILKSQSGKHPECGYPIGEILCRDFNDIPQAIEDSGMSDPIITKYEKRVFNE